MAKQPPEFETAAGIGLLIGASRQKVNKHIKAAGIKAKNGKYEVRAVLEVIVENRKRDNKLLGSDPARIGQAEAKTRLISANAKMAEIELAEKEGRFVDIELVEEHLETVYTIIRQKILATPTKLAPSLVGIESRAEIQIILEAELAGVLGELANYDTDAEKLPSEIAIHSEA